MNRSRNTFKSTKPAMPAKPVVDISCNVHFPSLNIPINKTSEPLWNCEKVTIISDQAKRYKNGDIFDGEYDERGLPFYGRLTFSGGNVYEGYIQESWEEDPVEVIEYYDFDLEPLEYTAPTEYNEDEEEDWYEYYEEEPYVEPEPKNYGVMTFPDGSKFRGVFCFGDRSKWA